MNMSLLHVPLHYVKCMEDVLQEGLGSRSEILECHSEHPTARSRHGVAGIIITACKCPGVSRYEDTSIEYTPLYIRHIYLIHSRYHLIYTFSSHLYSTHHLA